MRLYLHVAAAMMAVPPCQELLLFQDLPYILCTKYPQLFTPTKRRVSALPGWYDEDHKGVYKTWHVADGATMTLCYLTIGCQINQHTTTRHTTNG